MDFLNNYIISIGFVRWLGILPFLICALVLLLLASGRFPKGKIEGLFERSVVALFSLPFFFIALCLYEVAYILPEKTCDYNIKQCWRAVFFEYAENDDTVVPISSIPECFGIDFLTIKEDGTDFSKGRYICIREILRCPHRAPYEYHEGDIFEASDQSYCYIGFKTSNPAEMQRLRDYLEKEIWSKKDKPHPPEYYGLENLQDYRNTEAASQIPVFIERPNPRAPSRHGLAVCFLDGTVKRMRPGAGWPVDEKTLSILQKRPMRK